MENQPTADPDRDRADIDLLARTVYGEARGEPVRGKEAVAAVIMNRVRLARRRRGFWWGGDIRAVCLKPAQFSCWNVGDPNRPLVESVDAGNSVFRTCQRVARRAFSGSLKDPTDGATHYHAEGILPPWARGKTPSARIGRHIFYNDVD